MLVVSYLYEIADMKSRDVQTVKVGIIQTLTIVISAYPRQVVGYKHIRFEFYGLRLKNHKSLVPKIVSLV
jgi:hypothetical protein